MRDISGLVFMMGDTLWPQLDAVAQWARRANSVHMLLTRGDDHPGGSADRFERFLVQHAGHATVHRVGPLPEDDPSAVTESLQQLIGQGGRWLIDASGGSRLMFAGVLNVVRHSGVRIVYREADGPWYELYGSRATQMRGLFPRALDRFPVHDLLAVTWPDGDRTARVSSTQVLPAIRDAATREVRRPSALWADGFWTAVTQVEGRPNTPGVGLLFEQYVVAVLHGLGFDAEDLTVGVTLQDEGTTLQEVDVVVNSGGWLHVIDCKLSSGRRRRDHHPVPLGTQIREAFATKRHLGDGGDKFILLRPFLVVPEEFHGLCEEYGVTVIDKTALLGRSLSEVLATRLMAPGTDKE